MKKVIEACPDGQDEDKKEKTAENKNEGVIHRDISENEKETNWDTLKKVIEK